jgi:hypothetical protein
MESNLGEYVAFDETIKLKAILEEDLNSYEPVEKLKPVEKWLKEV